MASLNRVTLIGNLGADPEVRSFANGGRVAQLRIATAESWRDKASGEKRERTEWHTVQITNDGLAGIAQTYLRKGSRCMVEGALRTRKWQDREGNDRYSTEVVVAPFSGTLLLLDRPGGRDAAPAKAAAPESAGGWDGDDDVPF